MALTTAQQVRLRIQDIPRRADVTRYGDGTANTFTLDHQNVQSGTAYVPGGGGSSWTATGCTFDATGFVQFSGVPSANSAVRFEYVYNTFSDNEIGHFTALGGTVAGAALEAVRALMFDGLKRAMWAAADGSQYDDTAALKHLISLESALRNEVTQEVFVGGAIYSWSETQEDW